MQAETVQAVAQQHVAGLQMLHQLHIEHATFVGRVRTERKVLQRSGLQIEQSHYLYHQKAATGFWPASWGYYCWLRAVSSSCTDVESMTMTRHPSSIPPEGIIFSQTRRCTASTLDCGRRLRASL